MSKDAGKKDSGTVAKKAVRKDSAAGGNPPFTLTAGSSLQAHALRTGGAAREHVQIHSAGNALYLPPVRVLLKVNGERVAGSIKRIKGSGIEQARQITRWFLYTSNGW